MARPSKRERRLTTLQCNSCGNQFEGQAMFVSIESEEGGTIGWRPDSNGTRGTACPHCGSIAVGVLDD